MITNNNYSKIYLVLLFFLCSITISFCGHNIKDDYKNLKPMSLTLFQQQQAIPNNPIKNLMIIDQASFQQLPNNDPNNNVILNQVPVGTISILNTVPLTAKPEPNSQVLGSISGMTINSNVVGLESYSMSKISVSMHNGKKAYTGSMSILGPVGYVAGGGVAFPTGDKSSAGGLHMPVAGGTGDFTQAVGTMIVSPLSGSVTKIDLLLMMPHA